MAHAFAPAVPYTPMYWQLGRFFDAAGPLSSLQYTYAYIGFETIGICALLPAEVSLSLWLFFVLNRVQVLAFAAVRASVRRASVRPCSAPPPSSCTRKSAPS